MGFIKQFLIPLLLVVGVFAMVAAQQTFDSRGKPLRKVARNSAEPKMVMDTVSVIAGFGTLNLNSTFSKRKHRVSATSGTKILATITQIMSDTSGTVYTYSYVPSEDGKSLTIKSSGGAADTSLVAVQIFLR